MESGLADAERLERRFDAAMEDIYHAAARLGYRLTRFLEMVRQYGGLATAHRLLATDKIQDELAETPLRSRAESPRCRAPSQMPARRAAR